VLVQLSKMLGASRQLAWLRLLGAVLLTVAIFLIEAREGRDWSDVGLFAIAAVACLTLFAFALALAEQGTKFERWQSGLSICGFFVAGVALVELAQVLGANDSPGSGAIFWITALIAIGAAYASIIYDSPVHILIAALAAITSFFAFLDFIGTDLEGNEVRNIFAGFWIVYWFGAYAMRTYTPRPLVDHSHYIVLSGGLAGIIAGTLGAGQSIPGELLGASVGPASRSNGWEFFLLFVSVALIGYTFWQDHRASAYLGIIGLYAFLLINGSGDLAGWPVILLIVGLAALIASLFGPRLGGLIKQVPSPPAEPPVGQGPQPPPTGYRPPPPGK
jgi:hypothetical protein